MGFFRKNRNVELSTIYYLETAINADWSNVSTVKSFTQASKTDLPVICVKLIDNNPFWLEIGTNQLVDVYGIVIDVFGTSSGQLLDLSDYIKNKLNNTWTYYEHSQDPANKETLIRTENGKIRIVTFLEDSRLDFGEEGVDSRDKFRHVFSFQVRTSII